VTNFYFVPELMDIIGTEFSTNVNADLQSRGSLWVTLSLIRTATLVVLAIILYLGLTKPVGKQA
ncbi:MAG: hypothetical protein KDD03_04730, partial [Gelidibacter sp.]|nr:hypothetical protein [Gelidibacter sp.]